MRKEPKPTPGGDFGPDADRTRPDSYPLPSGSPDPSQPDCDQATTGRWVTVQGAADALSITVEAVRARTRRGTLPKEKASDGTVYVWLDPEHYQPGSDQSTEPPQPDAGRATDRIQQNEDRTADRPQPEAALVEALRDHLDILRTELEDRKEEARRKDAIIMSLSQRIPELETPSESREAPETDAGMADKGEVSRDTSQQRSWLYRFFFGP